MFLLQLHLLSRFSRAYLQQLFDNVVDVDLHLLIK
jgi:hypothetical protein